MNVEAWRGRQGTSRRHPHFKQVAIIGVGLIGGSLGMILRRYNRPIP